VTGRSEIFTVFPLRDECVPEAVVGEPCCLIIGKQLSEVSDMNRIENPPYVYVTDNDGKIVDIGDEENVWKVTTTIKEGPPGATIEGMTSVAVVGGFANFTNITLSPEGTFILSFILTDPEDEVSFIVTPVDTEPFNVRPPPLTIKFDAINDLTPNGEDMNVRFVITNQIGDTPASQIQLEDNTWECILQISGNDGVKLSGKTKHMIRKAGSNEGVFSIGFKGSATNIQLVATCYSPQSERTIIGESNPFTVYPSTTITQQYTYCALQRLVDLYRYVGVWEKCLRLYCNSKGYCTKKWLIKCSMGSTAVIKRKLTASIAPTNSQASNEFALFSSNSG